MSEELKAKGLTKSGIKIGNKYEWYNIGNTTIKELAKYNIVPNKDYGDYNKKRPDGLLVDRSNKKTPRVIAVIEYKDHKKFKTNKDVQEAIEQCNDYAQALGAFFGVATDTNVSYWINPHQEDKDHEYTDSFESKKSYSYVRNEEQQTLSDNFFLQLESQTDEEKLDDDTKNTLRIIKRIMDSNLSKDNSSLTDTDFVDPTNLAKSVWQDIYVATGKEPIKCLYNVVELFIFKFLSDLGVLDEDNNFDKIVELCKKDEKRALEYYAKNTRPEIRNKFPSEIEAGIGVDKTTIINGTIFVEGGNAVLTTAGLFKKSILKYNEFSELINVDKSFKTKLFETFLKRENGVKGMGQFFTPRKVIKSIIDMAKVERLTDGTTICDPFCGVGGFPLEVMAQRNNKDFEIKNGNIFSKIKYYGFDKGADDDAERTIILAKANMLIYVSDLLKNNPTLHTKFAGLFNATFKLKKTILGTLDDVSDDKYDLILTNPPYVTAGSSILKEEIKKDGNKQDFFKINATGVEGLAVEWIVRKLNKGGRAFVVVPDGIFNRLNDNKLRKFIMDECEINGVISLPINTFFTTPKKTYILSITKKQNRGDVQTKPIFTYLVSDIGETLDVYRFDTGKSELEKASKLFRMFEGNEEYFESDDPRCKIQPISKFKEEADNNWTVDRWWTKEEKIELGIEEQEEILDLKEFLTKIQEVKGKVDEMEKELLSLLN